MDYNLESEGTEELLNGPEVECTRKAVTRGSIYISYQEVLVSSKGSCIKQRKKAILKMTFKVIF